MNVSLSAIFSIQDKMSSKLAGIAKEGKSATSRMKDVGTAIDKAFTTKSVDEFEKKTGTSISNVEKTVNSSSKNMEKSVNDSFDGMQKSVKKLDKDLDKLGKDTLPDAGKELKNLGDESDDTGKSVEKLDDKSSSLGGTLKKLAGIIGTVFAINKFKDFANETLDSYIGFESSMKEVYTLLPGITKEGMDEMERQAADFGKEMGTLTTEVVPALYEALSSGVPEDTVFDFLEVANKAAIGGVTSMETTVDGLTSVINAYGADVIDVGTASDLMFETVKLGKATFDELSRSLYNVNPTAAAAGIKFQDVSAALAAMTSMGVPTSVATTQLRQALVELTKTGTKVDEIFRKVAGKSFKDFIASGGNMQEGFQLLEKYASDSNLSINDLFGSVEAGNAVLSLTGKGTELFTEAMETMENAAGSTDAAYDVMTKSVTHKLDVLAATWENIKITAGESLGEAIAPLADDLSNNIEMIKEPISNIFSILGSGLAKLGTLLPKALRGLSNGLESIGNVAGPLFTWIEKNPNLIGKVITGIGSAIIAYKLTSSLPSLANGINGIGKALKSNPWALLATVVVTAIVTIAKTISDKEKEMKKASLEEHFGSITLSLEDLEGAASHILKTDVLGKLGDSLNALDTVEKLSESMEEAVDEINKLNWKVSIGMKLTDEEKQSYMSSVTSFISDAQDLLSEQRYAMTINMQIFTNEGSEGDLVEEAMGGFYQRNQTKVAELGAKLQEKVNEAFEDGLLDIDEASVIADYMQQISEITSAISNAEYEASLERLAIDYGGTTLTPDSFQQLQGELTKQMEAAITGVQDAYESTVAQYKVAFSMGEIDTTTYESALKQAKENYLQSIGEIELKAADFQLGTILSSYGNELGEAFPELEVLIQENMEGAKTLFGQDLDEFYRDLNKQAKGILDKGDMLAIEELFDLLEPTQAQLKALAGKYIDAGLLIPETLEKAILNSASVGALTDNIDQIKTVMGNAIADEEGLKTQTESYMNALTAELDAQMKEQYPDMWEAMMRDRIRNNPIDIEVPIDMKFRFNSDNPLGHLNKIPPSDWRIPMSMPGHADGGIFDVPHIAKFAEEGPEAAIPIDGSANAINLWRTTGRLMGLYDEPLEIPDSSNTSRDDSTVGINNRYLTIEIKGIGTIQVNRAMSKEDVVNAIYEYAGPAFKSVIADEIFEEGDGSYEF